MVTRFRRLRPLPQLRRTGGSAQRSALTGFGIHSCTGALRPVHATIPRKRVNSNGSGRSLRALLDLRSFFVAELAETIIGVAGFSVAGATGKTTLMAVNPAHRGLGVGERLHELRMLVMRERGCAAAVTNPTCRRPSPGTGASSATAWWAESTSCTSSAPPTSTTGRRSRWTWTGGSRSAAHAPDVILGLAERMHDRGIKPELEVFERGCSTSARTWRRRA